MSASQDEILSGDDALVAVADMLYQNMVGDDRFATSFETVDLPMLAGKLRRLLGRAFAGAAWPEIHVAPDMMDGSFENFASLMTDAMKKGGDENPLLVGLDMLESDFRDDERLAAFLDHMSSALVSVDAEGEDEEHIEDGGDNDQNQDDTPVDAGGPGVTTAEINVTAFENLEFDVETVQALSDSWRLFISTAESREAAGEAIYAALFEGAPSLQSLFTTPRAVQAMRFMNGLAGFVQCAGEPKKLKVAVETLGFGHLHLDVTIPRVIIFRDAVLDLFMVELGEKFNTIAYDGWKRLLNYVGGALIFVKVHYAERINTLLRSWKMANHGDSTNEAAVDDSSTVLQAEAQRKKDKQGENDATNKKRNRFRGLFSSSTVSAGRSSEQEDVDVHGLNQKGTTGGESLLTQKIPKTYPEMFLFNAAVMGFGNNAWMSEALACFDKIVENVSNSSRLQEECDVLSLRIARVSKGSVNLAEYKSCMLASLRSLLPKDWDSSHEVAWTWLWDNVERLIKRNEGLLSIWEKALSKLLRSINEETKFEIRKDIYARAFALAPAIQDFFKQSNTYLHFIADKILAMTMELYQNPVKMADDVSALGLRHVGYATPTELFGPFVTACVEVLMGKCSDDITVEAFRWSLGLISKMLCRTITEGSTIVMKAVNMNSQKALVKAISCAPRGDRATWMLTVQVGTQRISPLAWSIESGQFKSAAAMIQDLLTFRADRDRYYYGVDEMFKRHPDLIKMLCDMSPDLIPALLDGLVWRSRLTDNGTRRVNYYVKHLLVDEEGGFSKTLQWISRTRDPKLVCHPVIVLVSDIIWARIAYRSFLHGKSWLLFTLLIFITSQSVLQNLGDGIGDVERYCIFGCRCFIYFLSMTRVLYHHLREFFRSYKSKDFVIFLGIPFPRYLKQWQDKVGLSLAISLVCMLCLEPILWCMGHQHGKLFLETCTEKEHLRMPYTIFTAITMFFYFSLLIDLTVVSTRISAFNLVCFRMLPEVGLYIGALAVCILTFSSAISVLKQNLSNFAGIHKGVYALFRMTLSVYDASAYADLRDEPIALAIVFVFGISAVVFLSNLLIAQLSCAYSSVYEDMVGYARLQRATIIVEIMPSIPRKQWQRFVDSLALHKRIEFNPGDVGVAGGLQTKEAASANPTTVDTIRRFGGSTARDIQWPEDDLNVNQEDDRFERLEKLVQKSLSRVAKNLSGRYHGDSSGSSSQNTNCSSGSGRSDASNADE